MSVETYATTKCGMCLSFPACFHNSTSNNCRIRLINQALRGVGHLSCRRVFADRADLLMDNSSFHACCITVCTFAPGEHICHRGCICAAFYYWWHSQHVLCSSRASCLINRQEYWFWSRSPGKSQHSLPIILVSLLWKYSILNKKSTFLFIYLFFFVHCSGELVSSSSHRVRGGAQRQPFWWQLA